MRCGNEVVHAAFGRKWSVELMGEKLEFVREVAQKEALDQFWAKVGAAQREWKRSIGTPPNDKAMLKQEFFRSAESRRILDAER
jgi:nitroimidazol reductase NimA-like FMN-containing flavoprotein (pyridoxamine 5'-phosphate oxidase superfamily)